MAQQGSIIKRHGAWYIRLSEKIVQEGVANRKQYWKWLARVQDYPKKSEVLTLAQEHIRADEPRGQIAEPRSLYSGLLRERYLPAITGKLAHSTVKGYKDSWRCHIKKRITGRVRDFRTVDGENLMTEVEAANKAGNHDLAHGTYRHIKVTLSAMFTFAKRRGVYEGANPMTGVTIPKGKRYGRKRLTYSLDEIQAHLHAFADDPLVQAIIGIGSFAGLRLGEIRGLWVDDDEGHILNIRRSVWRT